MIRPELTETSGGGFSPFPAKVLHVVIVHDDIPAYGAALRLLVQSLGDGVASSAVQPLPWRFSRLANRGWRQRAWDDAARADIFVVAKAPGTPLPEDMVDWLEISFERRRNRETSVIWLEPGTQPEESATQERARLRRSAEAAGLHFQERRDVWTTFAA